MLKQKYVKSRNVCKVTFELPAAELPDEIAAEQVHVVGDFNGWAPGATPMKRVKSTGAYKAIVELEPAASYQFRYLINESAWCNDPEASDYLPNQFGSHNSVVITSAT